MPRQKNAIPSYLLHKRSGQARVRIEGRDFLLGPFGSELSRIRYGELIAKFASDVPLDPLAAGSNRGTFRGTESDDPGPSIAELIVAFLAHAEQHYVKNGQPTSEQHCIRSAVRPLRELYELLPAKDFGPLTTSMIDRSGAVWRSQLTDHKCQHKGKARTLHFGPKGQLILAKYLSADPDKRLFSMTRCAYCRAITRGCEAAFGMPDELRNIDKKLSEAEKQKLRRQAAEWRAEHCWSPHWMRHTFATRVREQHGIENVQSLLGHSDAEMPRHYSAKMDKLAAQTAAACG